MKFRQYLLIAASILVSGGVLAGCKDPVYPDIDAPDPNRSGTNEITKFDFKFSAEEYPDYQEGDAAKVKYFPEKDSVYVFVPWYAGIILAPEITVSPGATVAPISGSVRDFSQGSVTYTVRAENGQKKEWKVYVQWQEEPEPMPRNPNPRHILDDGDGKYRVIKFNTWGNSYATGSNVSRSGSTGAVEAGTTYITNTANPTDDNRYHSVYFIARHAGELQMALQGATGNTTGNTIKVKAFVNGTQAMDEDGVTPYDHSYLYNKTATTDTLTLHRLILPEIPEGHVGHLIKLELRGSGARQGSYYYRFYNMWVSGWATRDKGGATYDSKPSGLNFSYSTPRDGQAAPSIHLNMIPPAGNMEYFYTEIHVPVGYDPNGAYFMTSGSGQGYGGVQVNSSAERRYLFSIWSPVSEEVSKVVIPGANGGNGTMKWGDRYNPKVTRVQEPYNSSLHIKVFGGEGTGAQCYQVGMNWKAGETVKALSRIRPHPDQANYPNTTLYKMWYNNGSGWIFMCEYMRQEVQPSDLAATGVGSVNGPYWYTGASHFIEDPGGTSGRSTYMAYYPSHWFITDRGEYVEPTAYSFTGDQAEGRADVAGSVMTSGEFANAPYLKVGGYFTDFLLGTSNRFTTLPGTPPDLDLDALNAMGSTDAALIQRYIDAK